MTIEFSVLHVLGKNMYRNDNENFHTTSTGKEHLLCKYKKEILFYLLNNFVPSTTKEHVLYVLKFDVEIYRKN